MAFVHVTLLKDDGSGVLRIGGADFFGDGEGACGLPSGGGVACHVGDRHHGSTDLAEVRIRGHGLVNAVVSIGGG